MSMLSDVKKMAKVVLDDLDPDDIGNQLDHAESLAIAAIRLVEKMEGIIEERGWDMVTEVADSYPPGPARRR